MAGKNEISVKIKGDADFDQARREVEQEFARMERSGDDAVEGIERRFAQADLDLDVDTGGLTRAEAAFQQFTAGLQSRGIDIEADVDASQLQRAFELASRLDETVATVDINTDPKELVEAERIAKALRGFVAKIDLDVDGRADLLDALGVAENLDKLRETKVAVAGLQDLERAERIADGLDQRRTIQLDVDTGDLDKVEGDIAGSIGEAGSSGAERLTDALSDIDLSSLGGTLAGQLSSGLAAAGPWAAAAAGVAAIFGDDLIEGFDRGFSSRRNEFVRSITSGLSDADLAESGRSAGEVFGEGFGEGFAEVQANADTLQSVLGDFEGFDLTATTEQATVLADLLGVEVPDSATRAARAIRQGLATDVEDAYDIMIGATREFGDVGVEALEIVSEFGGNFQRFGVGGDNAVALVATAFRTGLTPTIDRAGESFEEFQTRIADGDAEDAIRSLGLNFQQLQQDVAAGGDRANRAFQQVVEALIATDDQAKLNAASNAIFGGSIEQVSDRAEYLELILAALTGELGDYAGQAEEVARLNEEAVSGFERLQRKAEDVASVIGGDVDRQMGQLADVLDAAGDAVDRGVSSFTDWLGITDDAADGTGRLSEELSTSSIRARDAADGFTDVGDTASDASDEITGMADSVADLESQFNLLFNFQPDQVLRSIHEEGARLADVLNSDASAAVGLNGAIDPTTEAGRRLQAQMERLSDEVHANDQLLAENKITVDQWKAGQQAAEEAVRRHGAAAKLTEGQIAGLLAKYVSPAPIVLNIVDNASSVLGGIKTLLDRLQSKTITVTAAGAGLGALSGGLQSSSSSTRPTRNPDQRASGGWADGLTLINERGPELIDFTGNPAYIHDAATTARALPTLMGGGPGAAGPARVVLEINSGGSALDDLLVEMLRKAVRNRGGGVEAVLG